MNLINKIKFMKRLRMEADWHPNPFFRALAERDYRAWKVNPWLRHPMLSAMPFAYRPRFLNEIGAFAPITSLISQDQEANAFIPANRFQIADTAFTTTRASGTTAAQTIVAATTFRAYFYLKTMVLGANTNAQQGPICLLQVADNSAMSTNLTVLGGISQFDNVASSTEVQTIVITSHMVPVASKTFARVIVDPTLMGAASSGTFDVQIDAC